MRITLARAGAVGVSALAVGAIALPDLAGATASSRSGAISIAIAVENNGKPLDVVTGAITDHGTDRSIGQTTEKVVLSKGTFEVDATKFDKSIKFKENTKDCSASGTGAASNLTISDGTGAYAGISGSISLKATFVDVGVIKNGKCEIAQMKVAASLDSFSGVGHVSY